MAEKMYYDEPDEDATAEEVALLQRERELMERMHRWELRSKAERDVQRAEQRRAVWEASGKRKNMQTHPAYYRIMREVRRVKLKERNRLKRLPSPDRRRRRQLRIAKIALSRSGVDRVDEANIVLSVSPVAIKQFQQERYALMFAANSFYRDFYDAVAMMGYKPQLYVSATEEKFLMRSKMPNKRILMSGSAKNPLRIIVCVAQEVVDANLEKVYFMNYGKVKGSYRFFFKTSVPAEFLVDMALSSYVYDRGVMQSAGVTERVPKKKSPKSKRTNGS